MNPAAPAGSVEPAFRFGRREHLINFGFWTLFGAVTAATYLSNDYDPTGRGATVLEGVAWFIHAYLWAASTPVIVWLVWRFNHRHTSLALGVLELLSAGVVLVLLVGVARDVVWTEVLGFVDPDEPRHAGVYLLGRARPIAEPVVFASIVVAAFVREHLLLGWARDAHAAEMEAHAVQLQAQLAQARLAVLRSQLNPHFLFNTLNAIAALVYDDPKSSHRMITRLSELLRYALEERESEEIPLREELRLTTHYLEILELRFQGRLQTTVRADAEVQDALVPTLILQPLVENSMKHGVAKVGGRGRIEVDARRSGDSLVLTVHDTGGGANSDDPAELGMARAGSGVGLANTRARLQELYGPEQRFSLQASPEGGTSAEIVVPFRSAGVPVTA